MARQYRRGRKRVLYYAVVHQLVSVSGNPLEQDWQIVHLLPAKTPERAYRTMLRLSKRFGADDYQVTAPMVRTQRGHP